MKIYPQIALINADYFHPFSLRRGEAYRIPSHPCSLYQWLFSQEFPMGGLRHTKRNENNPQILGINADFHSLFRFLLIRVSSYPCFLYQWLSSQEFPMSGALTKMDENSEYASECVSIHSALSTQHSVLFS